MSNPLFFKKYATRLGLFLSLMAAPLQAAENYDEMIITATKRPELLQDVGASVVVISGSAIDQGNNFNGAEDLVQHVAGLQAAIANGTQVAFQIRGIGAVDHQALTPTATAVYADGVYMSTNVQNSLLTFDLDRVEVLKGPQGSLYGRNASGGAIHFLSQRPNAEAPQYITANIGTDDLVNLAGALESSLHEKLSLRVAGRYFTRDSVLNTVSTSAAFPIAPEKGGGQRDEFGLRAQALYQPDDGADILVNIHYAEDNGINAAPRNDNLGLRNHQISIGEDGIQDTDNEFYGGFIEYKKSYDAYDLFSLTAYEGYNQQYGFDFDGTPAPFDIYSLNANLAYDRDLDQFSQELRLTTQTLTRQTLFGLYGVVENFQQDYLIWCGELDPQTLLGSCPYIGAAGRAGSNPISTSTVMSLLSQINQKRRTLAAYSYNHIHLNQSLSFILGGRYSWENIKAHGQGLHIFDDGTIGYNNRNDLGLAIGGNEITESHFNGTIGLNYQPTDDILYYASVNSGYKSGGFNGEVQNNATHFQDEGLFKAETVTALEIGSKWSHGHNMNASLAAFYQWYDKPQARIFVPFPLPGGGSFTTNSLSNLHAATSTGIEAEIDWRPSDGLQLTASGLWLDTKIDQPFDPALPANNSSFDGNSLPFASKFAATVSARYDHELATGGTISSTASIKHQGAFYFDPQGNDDRRQKSYNLLGASVTWQPANSNIEASLWGKNLTDEDYAVAGFAFIGYNRFIGDPRSAGVQMRYNFQ
ncbi:MAG: TonB-dependent receptor [bacterium]